VHTLAIPESRNRHTQFQQALPKSKEVVGCQALAARRHGWQGQPAIHQVLLVSCCYWRAPCRGLYLHGFVEGLQCRLKPNGRGCRHPTQQQELQAAPLGVGKVCCCPVGNARTAMV